MFRSSLDHLQGILYQKAYIKHRFTIKYIEILVCVTLSDISSELYMCLFDVKLPEEDLNEIETCCSISALYVKACF